MKVIDALYKSYVMKGVIQDVAKFAKDNLSDVEWNRGYWLRKAGLSTYSPAKAAFSGLGLFCLGLVAGGVAALAFAPKPGPEFRAEVKDKAMNLMGKAQQMTDTLNERTASARM